MIWIIQLLVNAGVLFLLANMMSTVKVKSYVTALGVAFVIGLLNATIGFLIRLPLNIITLGLLSFLVRLFVSAIVIRITDKIFSGFETANFTTAIIIAVILSFASLLVDFLF